jgi:hypothetical protein
VTGGRSAFATLATDATQFPDERLRARTCVSTEKSVASVASVATGLHALADRVVRLCPDRRDPEAFWEAKSEVAHALRELASKLGRAP